MSHHVFLGSTVGWRQDANDGAPGQQEALGSEGRLFSLWSYNVNQRLQLKQTGPALTLRADSSTFKQVPCPRTRLKRCLIRAVMPPPPKLEFIILQSCMASVGNVQLLG